MWPDDNEQNKDLGISRDNFGSQVICTFFHPTTVHIGLVYVRAAPLIYLEAVQYHRHAFTGH